MTGNLTFTGFEKPTVGKWLVVDRSRHMDIDIDETLETRFELLHAIARGDGEAIERHEKKWKSIAECRKKAHQQESIVVYEAE
jgi:hypothetical protein